MNIKHHVVVFTAVVIGLSSCKKGADLVPAVSSTTVSVINAGPDTLNFYQNGTRLNNTSNLYPFGVLSFVSIVAGTQNYQFKKAGSADALIDMPLTIDNKNQHTLFVAGESADKVFLLRDTTVTTSVATNCIIRFVNASPIASNLDIYIGSSFVYKNRPFKSATSYVPVSAGTVAISIYQAGTTTLLASGTLALTAGTTYTLYTKGVAGGKDNRAFGARILTR